jgi:hypothetical protein
MGCSTLRVVLRAGWTRAQRSKAYFGDGSGLSGVVGVIGFDGSGPLLSEEAGPPGVVAGTLP